MASPFSSSSRPTYGGFSTASPVASRSQWWTQDAGGGGGGAGAGGAQPSLSTMDDRMDEPEQAANYLPGFLSASSRGRSSTSEANPPSSQQQWLNNSGSRGMPSPPTARFGGGGLFDRSNTSPYNSPQALHSIPTSMNHEDAPPVDSLEDGDMFEGGHEFHQQDYTAASVSRVDPPPPSTNPLDSTIIVFGPPMSMLQPLLQHFEQFGEITAAAPDQGGGNWVTITYRHEQDASRAIKKNGDVLGGSYMIGVKWADPSRSLFASPASLFPSPSTSPKPLQPINPPPPSSGGIGTPVRLAPSSSAFRKLDQQQTLVAPKPVVMTRPTAAQEQQGKGGVFGKLGELVFGF